MSLGEEAVALAVLGWHVFPLGRRSKIPATKRGFHDATDDPDRVEAWWKRNPEHNIGIATGASRLLVVDLDTGGDDHCGAALSALCVLATTMGEGDLPKTYEVCTPSGGEHWYYCLPEGVDPPPCSASRLGWHIDVRSAGGYVVAQGSMLENGTYTTGADGYVEEAPAWLIDACHPKRVAREDVEMPSTDRYERYVATALEACAGRVALAPAGTRNNVLNAAAFSIGQLVGGGLIGEGDAVNHLLASAQRAGLGNTEAERTIISGLAAGMRNPRRPD